MPIQIAETNRKIVCFFELCAKGFEHDVDDPDVKNFYDTWALDTNFEEVLEWIFLEFFRSGNVYTYKAIAKYEPRVSNISPAPGQKPKKVNQKKAQGKLKEIEAVAQRILDYDDLNEEAIYLQIWALQKANNPNLAKFNFNSFCSKYEKNLGESYSLNFLEFTRFYSEKL